MKRIVPALAGMAAAGWAWAETAPENVAFADGAVAESLSGAAGKPDEGVKVISSRALGNCVARRMFSALPDVAFQGEIGPSLDGVADRWSAEELRGIVANAKRMFDGSMMPSFYKTAGHVRPDDGFTGKAGTEPLPPLLTARQIEDVVSLLLTLKE